MVCLGLPIKNGWIFHGELLNSHRVDLSEELDAGGINENGVPQ